MVVVVQAEVEVKYVDEPGEEPVAGGGGMAMEVELVLV